MIGRYLLSAVPVIILAVFWTGIIGSGKLSEATGPIPIFFHVVTDSLGVEGHVGEERLASQVDWLNQAFEQTSVSFYYLGSQIVVNQGWFEDLSIAPTDTVRDSMYQALGIDPANVINVYTAKLSEDEAHGLSHFPGSVSESSYRNGILLDYRVISGMGGKPGQPPSDEGDWLVHEMGHYFGLHHTFNAGPWVCSEIQKGDPPPCRNSGDNICDTLPHLEPSTEQRMQCTQLTCTFVDRENSGLVSQHNSNYMNYTSDACRDSFTPDQISVMRTAIARHRPALTSIDGLSSGSTSTIEVYPNPASIEIIVDFGDDVSGHSSWDITSVDGRTVMSGTTVASGPLTIGTATLRSGLYFLSVESGSDFSRATFVVINTVE